MIKYSYDTAKTFIKKILDSEETIPTLDKITEVTTTVLGFFSEVNDEFAKEKLIKEMETIYAVNPGHSHCLNDSIHESNWYDEAKKNINPFHWDQYKLHLLSDKGFSINVVKQLEEETLDKHLMNSIGNPLSKESFLKRGLVIGDVQSGKTSTFIGLMAKAADAGYRLFIILTGTVESLRSQTQQRIEEGFIGRDVSNDNKRTGLADKNNVTAFTSRDKDFVITKEHQYVPMEDSELVGIFVIKKNKAILTRVRKWLKSVDSKNVPLMIIDDEADNASVNTNDLENSPTIINSKIREILNDHSHATYVGFTATPFANVFIDPDYQEDIGTHDLFPENFIVSLPTSSIYAGAKRYFIENSKDHVRYIDDINEDSEDQEEFKSKHKKEWDGILPESLTKAICAFYIANAIRDLRGEEVEHRSMLVNISTYINVQKHIKNEVNTIHTRFLNDVRMYLGYDLEKSLRNANLNLLYTVWQEEYEKNTEFSWKEIAETIEKSIEDIKVIVVNSKSKKEKLNFGKTPVRVIAIGGLALSRGLTLEGLMISYFYRSTSTYDVLMQMGRWFGYRDKYIDITRIWISNKTAEWYREIIEATNELRDDVEIMMEKGKKPIDFGIRVRNENDELKITSRNKMRNTQSKIEKVDLFGKMIETPYLEADYEMIEENYNVTNEMLKTWFDKYGLLDDAYIGGGKTGKYIIDGVDKSEILSLIKKMNISKYCPYFNAKELSNYIEIFDTKQLQKWNVAIVTGDSENQVELGKHYVSPVIRNNCQIVSENNVITLKIGTRGKLGGSADGSLGYLKDDVQKIIDLYNNGKESKKVTKYDGIPSSYWFKNADDRRPLLIIYPIDVKGDNIKLVNWKASLNKLPILGYAIGLPSKNAESENVQNRLKISSKHHVYNAKINYIGSEIDNGDEGEYEL